MERIPILKMGPYLLVTIQVDMHDRVAMTLQDELTERIVAERARDMDAMLPIMRPAVAITLVELGLPLKGIRTALNVEQGMAFLRTVVG